MKVIPSVVLYRCGHHDFYDSCHDTLLIGNVHDNLLHRTLAGQARAIAQVNEQIGIAVAATSRLERVAEGAQFLVFVMIIVGGDDDYAIFVGILHERSSLKNEFVVPRFAGVDFVLCKGLWRTCRQQHSTKAPSNQNE